MADYGEKVAEKAIAETEKKIRSVYQKAGKDLQRKMDDFLQRHREKGAEMLEKLKNGEITQAKYHAWMRGQVFVGKQWQRKIDQAVRIMNDANNQAAGVVNKGKLNVFAENYNFAAYQLEKKVGGALSFDLYNERTVARLIRKKPKMLPEWKIDEPKDYKWNRQRVENAITQGIIQGEGIDEITDRMVGALCTTNENKMRLFSRTAITGSQNAGRQAEMDDAEDMGITVKKRWVATLDNRTRDIHQRLDGQVVPKDQPFEIDGMEIMFPGDPSCQYPELVYNCFPGETKIATDSEIVGSYKRWYEGELIKIKTSCGVEFSCTPNHPILTVNGWVKSASLNNGDNLIIASVRDGFPFGRNRNIEHIHSSMKALYNALHRLGLMSRDTTLSVNFHGDIPTTDVEVIRKERLLRDNGDSFSSKGIDKLLFKFSDEPLMGECPSVEHLGRIGRVTLGIMRFFCKPLSFIRRCVSHSHIHGFGSVSDGDFVLPENPVNDLSADTKVKSKLLDRGVVGVSVDHIVSVDRIVAKCHVYNLQTVDNTYFVNSISKKSEKYNGKYAICHNCRCTMEEVYDGIETRRVRRAYYDEAEQAEIDEARGDGRHHRDSYMVEDMTYTEWKEWKEKRGRK